MPSDMKVALVVALTVGLLTTSDSAQSHARNWNSSQLGLQRSEGAALNDWCIKLESGYMCEMVNGAECVDVMDGSVAPFSAACKCLNTYEPYTSNSGMQRCRMKWTSGTALSTAKCQIDEDCQHWYSTAVCNQLTSGLPGICDCPPEFVSDYANLPKCKAFTCTAASDCAGSLGSDSVCDPTGTKPTCKCKPNFYLAGGTTKQCKDFKNYACDSSINLCPSPLTCDSTSSRCVCAAGYAPSLRPGTIGEAECTVFAPTVGSACNTVGVNTDCPVNAECKQVGGHKMCLCKPYFRSNKEANGKTTCQTMLGGCCRTAADCNTKAPAISTGVAGSLQCLKLSSTAARGVCACAAGTSWDWNSFVVVGGTHVPTPACSISGI